MDWKTFLISVLGSGAVTALVNGWMNHRTQIRAIKESGLYAKRVEVLDELMKRMERLDRVVGELISTFQTETTMDAEIGRRQKTLDALSDFLGFFKRSRHYLSKKLSDEITILCGEYRLLFINFSYEARMLDEKPNTARWQELVKEHQGNLTEKKEKIAEEFRRLTGVN